MYLIEDDEDEKNYWKEKIRMYSREMSQHPRLGLNASDDHPPNLYVRTTPQFPNCGSGWERKRESLKEVVSYSGKLEARVNFYVEAVSGYDDTTDSSVRWVVYRSTIR